MDTERLRRAARSYPELSAAICEAADTIERLVRDKSLLMETRQMSEDRIRHITKERDAARAEVERLKAEVENLDNIRLAQP